MPESKSLNAGATTGLDNKKEQNNMSIVKTIDLYWPIGWEYHHADGYAWSGVIKNQLGINWQETIESCYVVAQPPDNRKRNKERIEKYIRWGLECYAINLKPESIRVSDTPIENGCIQLVVKLKTE